MQVYSIKIGEIWLLDPVHFRKKLLDLNSVTHLPFAFPFPFPVNHAAMLYFQIKEFNRMCTHQTNIKRNGKITDFDATWAG